VSSPSPDEALETWLALLAERGALGVTAAEAVPLGAALGRIAAADVIALHGNPPHRCAAMDGIAVRAESTARAPVVLRPDAFARVDTGECVEDAWDAVVPVEETAVHPDGVLVRFAVASESHVRAAGEDVQAGAGIVGAGTRLRPVDLALAAACGHGTLPVRRPPAVAILPTGDELRPAGSAPVCGETADANSVMLAGRVEEEGAAPVVLPIAPDDPEVLSAVLQAAAAECRMVLVLAGSSKGTRDHTADVIARCGSLAIRGVALRPAHPVLLGVVGSVAVVGVPGYPVSAAITFERFVLPVLDRLLGRVRVPSTIRVRLAAELVPRRDAEVVVPLALEASADGGPPLAIPQSRRGGALSALARAGATIRLPAGADPLPAGALVDAEL
jgi:molybdenum cofactor synthesis domain-containing protein